MMIIQFHKSLTKFILIILGIVLISIYIWFRFIRERLPRNIPFELSEITFIILTSICALYIYILISIWSETKINSVVLSWIINKIYKPLIVLDETIKTNKIIKPYYQIVLDYIIIKLKIFEDTKVYLMLEILPRIILVSALCVDVFYFKCLYLIYKVIIIGLIIIIGKYLLYSLKYAKEQYILELEYMVSSLITNWRDPEHDPAGLFLTNIDVRRFIDLQTFAIVYEDKEYTYGPFTSDDYDKDYCKRNNLPESHRFTDLEFSLHHKDFYIIMKKLISIAVYLEEYDVMPQLDTFKILKTIIFALYIFCWSYILFVSFHTLSIDSFSYIPIFFDTIEPFSGIQL